MVRARLSERTTGRKLRRALIFDSHGHEGERVSEESYRRSVWKDRRRALRHAIRGSFRELASRWRIRRLLRTRPELMVEVGAGNKAGAHGWITIDMTARCDVYWDLRRGLPFPDGSVSRIYSSHFLEHLSYPEAQVFLDECLRAMKPGGTFSVCVPNARIYLEAYVRGTNLDERHFGYKRAFHGTSRIEYVNYTAYMDGEHKYMFDEENLIAILRARGFQRPRLRAFDPSLDDKDRDFESIYAEAEK